MLQVVAAVGLGAGLSLLPPGARRRQQGVAPTTYLGFLVIASTALLAVAVLRRDEETRVWAERAAAALPVVLLLALIPIVAPGNSAAARGAGDDAGARPPGPRRRRPAAAAVAGYAAGVTATLLAQAAWTWSRAGLRDHPDEIAAAFALETVAVLLFTAWPFLAIRMFAPERGAWYAAALAGPAWFPGAAAPVHLALR